MRFLKSNENNLTMQHRVVQTTLILMHVYNIHIHTYIIYMYEYT